jgi:prepilin-type N-terminal cleavage/methylation domain-containing protein
MRSYGPNNRRSRSGFTLIEMIVATVVLAIGVIGTVGAFNAATKASVVASEQQTATMLAQKQIAEAETQAEGNITGGESDGDFGIDYPGFRWKQSITATDYTYLFQISVTVSWGPAPQRQRTVTTYLVSSQTYSAPTTTAAGGAGG